MRCDIMWQFAPLNQNPKLHVQVEGVLRQIGTRKEEPLAVSRHALHVENALLPGRGL